MQFNFIGDAYTLESLDADCQSAINVYPQFVESGTGKSKWVLRGRPGLAKIGTLPGAVRALWPGENRLFAVAGSRLCEIFAGGSYDDRGDVGNDGNPAVILPNGNQLLVVSAGKVYCDNGDGPVQPRFIVTEYTDLAIDGTDNTKVSSTAYPFDATDVGLILHITGGTGFTVQDVTILSVDGDGVATCSAALGTLGSTGGEARELGDLVTGATGALLDGFFLVGEAFTSNKFFKSALNDGTTWYADEFEFKEAYPDNLWAMLADHEDLWLFGSEQSAEVWRNTGAADFPFERDPGAVQHYGLLAPASPVRLMNGVAWLGGDVSRGGPQAFFSQGFIPQRVSTHAIEQAWAGYATCKNAVSCSLIWNGHHFWVISFPSGNATWVYDATLSQRIGRPAWHQWGWWNGTGFDRHRVAFHAYVDLGDGPKHYGGDWQTGDLYVMSAAYTDDAGTIIMRERTAPHLFDEQEEVKIVHHRLQLDVETGQITDPQFSLYWSNDHGHTWTSAHTRTGGASGNYTTRVIWRRLGAPRDRVYRIRSSAGMRHTWINAYLRATKGTS
ncbi:MAG TPA: hypothetical protein VFA33_07550 [Bryobacteraceae bacterium]|nr:hypothetical protein [Bryobacteraceae bacterium]